MKKYFLHSNGQHIGPYSAEELRMMGISPSTPIWYEGLGSWQNAGDVPELKDLFSIAPPAPSPPPSFQQQQVYRQPVTPYYYTTEQPQTNTKKKSGRVWVFLIVGVMLVGISGLIVYTYQQIKEAGEETAKIMRDARDREEDTLANTLPYSYDTSGIKPKQKQPPKSPSPGLFHEEMPEFPGGKGALNAFIRDNVKYPPAAKYKGIQGTVYVQFTVEKNGEVTNRKVARGVSPELDQEAMRMLWKMPKWKPGTMNGTPVRIEMTQPIRFTLQ